MRKILLLIIAIVVAITFASCSQDKLSETAPILAVSNNTRYDILYEIVNHEAPHNDSNMKEINRGCYLQFTSQIGKQYDIYAYFRLGKERKYENGFFYEVEKISPLKFATVTATTQLTIFSFTNEQTINVWNN